MHNGGMAGEGSEIQAGSRGQDIRETVFAANPFLRQNYGKILDHLEPEISMYRKVFVLSEFELGVFGKLHKKDDIPKSWPEVNVTLGRLFPDLQKSLTGLNETERTLIVASLAMLGVEKDRLQAKGPGALSFLTGEPGRSQAFGILYLPERLNILPENIGGKNAPHTHDHEDRLRDTTAFTIAHETGHLVDNFKRNLHTVMFGREMPPKSNYMAIPENLSAEIESDRFGKRMVREMAAKGIVLNPGITDEIADSRRISSFERMVSEGDLVPTGFDKNAPKQAMFAAEKHSTGFAFDTDSDPNDEHARLSRLAVPILDLRDKMTKQIFNASLVGAAPEPYQKAFITTMAANIVQNVNAESKGEPQASIEKKFRQVLWTMPEFVRSLADSIRTSETIQPDTRGLAQQYLEASGRMDERIKEALPMSAPQPVPKAQPALEL